MARNIDTEDKGSAEAETREGTAAARRKRRALRKSLALDSDKFDGYVVAIGASAGGLDALERFFNELPSECGAAFVVVQHLSPDHKSMMDNLLARHTEMPVAVAENGMLIEVNRVYLIPPGKNMTITGAELRLIPKDPHRLSLPIDLFFSSLAAECGKHAVGVVLSGTGSDGSRGAVAINDAGGFLLAQEPDSAKFDGMPRSVIATGLVDEIMPPEALAARVVGHVNNLVMPKLKLEKSADEGNTHPIDDILQLLQESGGVDFSRYKPATVQRRIERRLLVRHQRDLESYRNLLESDRNEVLTLKRDILIPVTSFFRDPDAFETLETSAVASIVAHKHGSEPVRVWVPGCSTGEEAYSIAIVFAEACDRLHIWPQIKIFATDVEQQYLDVAASGVYSQAIANEVSPERLERFFTLKGNQYAVKSEIRQNIVFARHNVLVDPPFTRMDLVSCRNTMIYFDPSAQERALQKFQYALSIKGYLFLGPSESLGNRQRDFATVSAKNKLYRLIKPIPVPLDLQATRLSADRRRSIRHVLRDKPWNSEALVIERAEYLLRSHYVPPALLINSDRELIHVYGDAHRFMRIPSGQASLDVAKLLIDRLSPVGVALIHKASKDNVQLSSEVRLPADGGETNRYVRLVATPVAGLAERERHVLLTFETVDSMSGEAWNSESIDLAAASNERIQNLERELSATRDSLQATIEELETSNEELQATNEELMASNEELQSTNEELQSVNEELYTVNSENQERIEFLNRLNADLDNMMRAALIPTLFVDTDFRLTRFTPEASGLFRIRESDIGRPIDDFAHNLEYPEFMADLQRTVETAQIIEREVRSFDGRWFLARLLPYIDHPHLIGGAVLTLFEITLLKDAQRLQAVLDSLPEHIAVLAPDGTIELVNKAWREFAADNGDRRLTRTGVGINYLEMCRGGETSDMPSAAQVADGLAGVLGGELDQFTHTYSCHSPSEQRWFLMHAAPVRHAVGGAVVSHVNITAWIAGDRS